MGLRSGPRVELVVVADRVGPGDPGEDILIPAPEAGDDVRLDGAEGDDQVRLDCTAVEGDGGAAGGFAEVDELVRGVVPVVYPLEARKVFGAHLRGHLLGRHGVVHPEGRDGSDLFLRYSRPLQLFEDKGEEEVDRGRTRDIVDDQQDLFRRARHLGQVRRPERTR